MAHVMPQPASTEPGESRAPRGRRPWRNTLIGWSFILPNFLGFALFTLVPVIAAFVLAFMDWDSYGTPEWVGLGNFERLCGDENFHVALRNTLYYAVGHVPLTLVAALALAMVLNRKLTRRELLPHGGVLPVHHLPGRGGRGLEHAVQPDGGPDQPVPGGARRCQDPPRWVSSTDWAMPAVIITSVWRDMGYYMVLYLAGLQTIPKEYYEAAEGGRGQRLAAVLEHHAAVACGPPRSSCWSC